MPYIKLEDRHLDDGYEVTIESIVASCKNKPGSLNYLFTRVIQEYLRLKGFDKDKLDSPSKINYDMLNEVIGVLECCKQEFYRRMVVPYETKKIIENGDVY